MIEPSPNGAWFSTTRWEDLEAIRNGGDGASAALDRFCLAYWMPVYCYIRKSGREPEDAADLTQSFFQRLVDRGDLTAFVPGQARFRSWLLVGLRRFLVDQGRASKGPQRYPGGGLLSLDAEDAEASYRIEAIDSESPEQAFDRRWAMVFFDEAMAQLEAECRAEGEEAVFGLLSADRAAAPLEEAAAKLGKATGTLKNDLTVLRKRYAAIVRAKLAETLRCPEEAEAELRHLIAAISGQ